jgi:hypothetical protein
MKKIILLIISILTSILLVNINIVSATSISSCQIIDETSIVDLNRIFELNTSILNNPGNCFILSTENITFDCKGFQISGNQG